ncbi:MAG TPA: hypothetical protein VK419_12600 [Bryobacteraceae bacterium]|nr:hypothetical protein [Bryobacteraceae bacterium]
MRKWARLAVAAVAATYATSMMRAEDGKKVTSRVGNCQATVPANWAVSTTAGIASSPDKKVSVAVGSPAKVASFDALKQNARKMYTHDKVVKDSAGDFQMEGQSMSGKPNVYRAIPLAAGRFCMVEVIYQSGTADDARKIAASLKPAK